MSKRRRSFSRLLAGALGFPIRVLRRQIAALRAELAALRRLVVAA